MIEIVGMLEEIKITEKGAILKLSSSMTSLCTIQGVRAERGRG